MIEMEIVRKITHLFYLFRNEHSFKLDDKNQPIIKHRDVMMLDAILKINDGDLVKMNDLSCYFQVTPAAISQMMKQFEKKGWIERIVLDSDRRSVYIKVNDDAKQMINGCEKRINETLIAFIETLGKEDSEAFVRILEKAVAFSKEAHHKKD